MRLRKIKLAGFKSFVDPTTLLVSDNLVGIVGPNGCGKSQYNRRRYLGNGGEFGQTPARRSAD